MYTEVSQSHGMQDSVASPPISAHHPTSQPGSEASEDHSPLYEESEGDIHLGQCENVQVELHDGSVGVNYAKDGKEAWTRVVRRRKNRLNVATNSDSSDGEIDVSRSRDTL